MTNVAGTVTAAQLWTNQRKNKIHTVKDNENQNEHFQCGPLLSDAGCSFTFLPSVCLCPVPLFCLYFSISTVCKWTLHVPVEMYPLQLTLLFLTVCTHNLTPKLNTLCAPALRHYAHTHTHTPRSNHVMTLTHPPLGDVKHQEEVSQGRHLPGVFILFYLFFRERTGCQRQAQGVGLHRASRAW